MSASKRPFTAPAARGRPYYDAIRGEPMIVPAGGGKAIPYIGPARQKRARVGRRALERAGLAADRGAERVGKAGLNAARRAPRQVQEATGTIGGGELLVWAGASLLGLALLRSMLSGGGPAGLSALLGLAQQGVGALFSTTDPLVPYAAPVAVAAGLSASGSAAASSGDSGGAGKPTTSARTSPARRTAAAATGARGRPIRSPVKVIGLPGQGTHSYGAAPNNWESDNAVDLAVAVGTPVYAVAAGVIGSQFGPLTSSGGSRFAGLRLHLVAKANEWYYAHLSKFAPGIKPGVRVKRGQLLGYSGSASGVAHLHFAQRAGDPRTYIR